MNLETELLRTELEDWCASYVAAFEAFDVEKIGSHWVFPALLVAGSRQFVMADAEAFNANTSRLVDFYKANEVCRVRREVVACHSLSETAAAMRVQDCMSKSDGEEITGWASAYVLRKVEFGWRAVFADASAEADAWAARGTPLGKKSV